MTDRPTDSGSCVTLHRAGLGDAEAITRLVGEAYAKWVPELGYRPLPMTVDYSRAVVEHRIDVLREGGELLGLIETSIDAEGLLVVNVAVAPRRHGEGLGRRLLAHAEELAREAGCGSIRLYTNAKMTSNIALYERIGYVREREEAVNGGAIVHLTKMLI
ncbi:GNAT family N-acetyltransferase [Rathayibacter sp. CAU 1779]